MKLNGKKKILMKQWNDACLWSGQSSGERRRPLQCAWPKPCWAISAISSLPDAPYQANLTLAWPPCNSATARAEIWKHWARARAKTEECAFLAIVNTSGLNPLRAKLRTNLVRTWRPSSAAGTKAPENVPSSPETPLSQSETTDSSSET